MLRAVFTLFFTCVGTIRPSIAEDKVILPWEEASQRITKHVPVTCPPIAKAARLRGDVKLIFVISTSGSVERLRVQSGHPMLTQAAIDSVEQWKFTPYSQEGQPVTVETIASVNVCGPVDDAYRREQKVNDAFFDEFHKCQEKVRSQAWAGAETQCHLAVKMSRELPESRYLERTSALNELGQSLLAVRRPKEARDVFAESLQLLEKHQKPDESELGSAAMMLAISEHASGNPVQADTLYRRAAGIFEAQVRKRAMSISDEIDKQMLKRYANYLKVILSMHARLRDELGDTAGADELRKRERDIK
jgi:TonB family protein